MTQVITDAGKDFAVEELRKAGKWSQADKIREKISKLGFAVEDTPSGPHLRKTK